MNIWHLHRWNLALSAIGCLFLFYSTVQASEIRLESPVEAVAVLELFTSHGCSSCPPADNWFRRFTKHPELWSRVIPMAFHVDYWDYLGWKDRFSRARYSKRQREYRRSGGIRSVYTPGFVLNGREWRGWFRGGTPELAPGAKVGRLKAIVRPGKQTSVRFMPVNPHIHKDSDIRAHIAILGSGISSGIGAGENSGRQLKEDFVVLGDSSAMAMDSMNWSIPWPTLKPSDASSWAVVIWLSKSDDPTPIQAVAARLHKDNMPLWP
jgi:hypothetical protein